MFFQSENGLQGGSYDVICILHDIDNKRYHAAAFEDKPFAGSFDENEDRSFVRLKSKMHHTSGAETLEEALKHLEDLKAKVSVPEKNVWTDPVDWDGKIGLVWMVPKYKFA
jgi:hypothetical protein